jgi:hypothetical protein
MSAEGPSSPPPANGAGASGGEQERFGPLLLYRLTKDDGRVLILYSRADEPEGDDDDADDRVGRR